MPDFKSSFYSEIIEKIINYLEKRCYDVYVCTSNKNINHSREDVVVPFDSRKILDQAPDEQDNYFVVPKII